MDYNDETQLQKDYERFRSQGMSEDDAFTEAYSLDCLKDDKDADLINELAEKNITYNIDDNAILRVYVGNRIWFECQDVKDDTQALGIIGDELPNLK